MNITIRLTTFPAFQAQQSTIGKAAIQAIGLRKLITNARINDRKHHSDAYFNNVARPFHLPHIILVRLQAKESAVVHTKPPACVTTNVEDEHV
jgi:hypothetical protein